MIVTTTNNIEGKKVSRYIGIVSGEAIIGANIVKDFFPSMLLVVVTIMVFGLCCKVL